MSISRFGVVVTMLESGNPRELPWKIATTRLSHHPAAAYIVIGFANFCILLLEVIAGRLLAPAIGSSLETWTGIIGMVLLGLAVGDMIGGAAADRLPSARLLGVTLFGAGVFLLLSIPTAGVVRGVLAGSPIMLRAVVIAGVTLFLPCVFLAAASPVAARLIIHRVDTSGRAAGALGVAASAGSLLAVALGGFVLLERFGVASIITASGLGIGLLGVTLALAGGGRGRIGRAATMIRESPSEGTGRAWVSVFAPAFAGASLLTIELAAVRLVAPLFGTSLYTWASAIGVVLLGIALGNGVGGRLADRWPTPGLLGLVLFFAGCASAGILVVALAYGRLGPALVLGVRAWLPPSIGLSLLYALLVLPASLLFGAVSPIAIRLAVPSVAVAGRVVGGVYAAQACGSIVGTFVTGFVLVSHFGARAVILIVAAAAWLAGALLLPGSGRRALVRKATTAILFATLLLFLLTGRVPSPCLRESNYYCIKVQQGADGLRALVLDSLIHSYFDPQNPGALLYEYEQGFAMVLDEVSARMPRGSAGGRPRALFIGGGGYVSARYFHQRYPNGLAEVVEIDPTVTLVAHERLGLPWSTPIRTWNEDGRQFFLRARPTGYDVIFADAFRDAFAVPAHLTTVEFSRLVAAALRPGGIYAVNIIDGRPGLFLRSYVRTLRQVFGHVALLAVTPEWQTARQSTYVVVASQEAIDPTGLGQRRPPGVPGTTTIVAISPEVLEQYLRSGPSIVLTDDHAPVENFLARVYIDVSGRLMRERRRR